MLSERIHILTDDQSLLKRLRQMIPNNTFGSSLRSFAGLLDIPAGEVVFIDLDTLGLPAANSTLWKSPCTRLKLAFLSSHPRDDEGISLLEKGACGYAHTYAAEPTLRQMTEVIVSGELWVGRSLMNRLLNNLQRVTHAKFNNWESQLTEREREVAKMTAKGLSNQEIAQSLGITERTIKSHLTAIFEKLGVTDRLQLALKVHGISEA